MDSNQEAANLAQIENTRLSRKLVNIGYATLIVCAIGTAFAGWAVLRSPDTAQAPPTRGGSMVSWIWLPAIILGTSSLVLAITLLIVAFRQWRYKKLAKHTAQLQSELTKAKSQWEQPDEKRLQLLAKEDREEIQEAVVVRGVHFRNEIEYGKRYVDFVFSVHNESHYDIAIDDKLGEGQIIFNKEKLVKGKEIVDHSAQNVPARSSGYFTIRQYLDSGDIDLIKSASGDRLFEFHDVKVKIKGAGTSKRLIQEKELRIVCYLSKENPFWRNYNGPFRSRFNGEIVGTIREVFFQSQFDVGNFTVGQDYAYDLFFVLHVYLVNHGAPTSIERFKLSVRVGDQVYEAERQPLAGLRIRRNGETDFKSLDDVEELNGVSFADDARNGWLRFRVPDVKRYQEDKPKLELELDAIDKNEDANRLRVISQSKWLGHAMFQRDNILGSDEWAENQRTTNT
jgi:hypothetical protein